MKTIKVAGAVLNQTPMDWDKNLANILGAIEAARKQQVSILCLPELCITGYGCEDMFYAIGLQERCLAILQEIVPHTQDLTVCVGLPLLFQNRLFNTSCVISDRKICGFVAKRFLAGNGIHYEPRWFTPWVASQHVLVEIDDKQYPMGDIHFDIGGVKVGFEICEDAWVANRPGRSLFSYGIDLILNPSASHFAFDKFKVRQRFVLEGSRAFGVGYVYSNLLGNEAGRAIYDGGVIIAANGELLALGERLSFEGFQITSSLIDITSGRRAQAQASTVFQVPEVSDNCIKVPFSYPKISEQRKKIQLPAWEKSAHLQEEEFSRALALGLYDYLRKSRSQGFVISLSGGADSSAVVVCCYLMLVLGIKSIGLEKFKTKLSHIGKIQDCQSIETLAQQLILTAYQPSENSGDVTQNAAQKLAEALSAVFYELNINEIVKNYTGIIENAIERPLSWETDDITLQNIQARVRAPSIWMLANIYNMLLLSTSNRSEAAVGYATMDGDTCGGLSPIAGIDKAFLRQWLNWIEKIGLENEIKVPALSWVNEQQPTAELRPQESKQTDEDDLMPYDLLDFIEEIAIRDKKMPAECLQILEVEYPQYKSEQLKLWLKKFFRLWSRNQWKRERYAPSFHLDDKNLDPKTWCRFPILSGGFAKELEEL